MDLFSFRMIMENWNSTWMIFILLSDGNECWHVVSDSGSVCVLRHLGWLRLLCSTGLQQPRLGNTAGYTTDNGTYTICKLMINTVETNAHTLWDLLIPFCLFLFVVYWFPTFTVCTEPRTQVSPEDGPFSGVGTSGQPLDVWRALSFRGHSRKCLQVWSKWYMTVLIKIHGMNDLFHMSIVYCFFKYHLFSLELDIQSLSAVGPKCWRVQQKRAWLLAHAITMPLRCWLFMILEVTEPVTASCWWWEVWLKTVWCRTHGVSISAA